jgi:hypothetical protein
MSVSTIAVKVLFPTPSQTQSQVSCFTPSSLCSTNQTGISSLVCIVEEILIDTINGVACFIEAGLQELVNYAPLLVNVPITSIVSSGVAYAFRQTVADIPLLGGFTSSLGRLLTF